MAGLGASVGADWDAAYLRGYAGSGLGGHLAVKNSGWVQAWWQGKCVTLDVSWMMAWLGARCLPGREDHYTVRIISEKGEQ